MKTCKNKRSVKTFSAFLIMMFFLLTGTSTFSQIVNSWDGWLMSPHGNYRALNLFINIIYDQNINSDPIDSPNSTWPRATVEGINNYITLPTYIKAPDPDLFDPYEQPDPGHGILTRKYFESSFGDFHILGDYVVVDIAQSSITPNH